MFMFNGAVMGFGSSLWMNLILEQFDNMVMNVANSYRLQAECDVLSLVLAKYKGHHKPFRIQGCDVGLSAFLGAEGLGR